MSHIADIDYSDFFRPAFSSLDEAKAFIEQAEEPVSMLYIFFSLMGE